MGYCVPAAMGAKVGRPDSIVWGIDGDGCFQMTNQELVTCALEGIPVKIAIINNQSLGMVRQWQTLFYEGRYSNTDLKTNRIPDFPKLAEAMGCVGLRAEAARRRGLGDREGAVDQRRAGGGGVRGAQGRDGVADGRRRHQQRRHQGGPRHGPAAGTRRAAVNSTTDADTHTLSVLVENKPGVLARVSGLISRRGYNIESLAVGPTEYPDMSRMTLGSTSTTSCWSR